MLEPRSYKEGSFWYYLPNKGAPIAFAILFIASGLVHAYQCTRYKSWKVTGLLSWSATLFVSGFILRSIAAFGEWGNLNIFIASTVLLLVAPPAYEAANFLILGRILYYIPYHSPIHPGRVFTTFIALGVVIEVLTANGAAILANTSNTKAKQDQGKSLIKAALILQLLLMVGFVSLVLRFYYKCVKANLLNEKVKRTLHVLLISCGLISIRTIYRTVEYFTAASLNITDTKNISPLLRDEWFFWFFEATVMFVNTAMLNFFHPMRSLPRSNKIFLAKDGVSEIEGPGFVEKRHFLLTVFDPFDVVGIIFRKKRHDPYWEMAGANTNTVGK